MAPERLVFGPDYNADGFPELFVTSFSAPGLGGGGQGTTVKWYDGQTGTPENGTGTFNQGGSLDGPSGLDFTPSTFL